MKPHVRDRASFLQGVVILLLQTNAPRPAERFSLAMTARPVAVVINSRRLTETNTRWLPRETTVASAWFVLASMCATFLAAARSHYPVLYDGNLTRALLCANKSALRVIIHKC